MEAPADQTMKEEEYKELNPTDFEVGLCQKCDNPFVCLCSLVCPCTVYSYLRQRQGDNAPLKYGCFDCICAPLDPPTIGALPDCISCCFLYGFGWAFGPPFASCSLRKSIRSQYYLDKSLKTQAKDCLTYTFLPWCAIYQDYSEFKVRQDDSARREEESKKYAFTAPEDEA